MNAPYIEKPSYNGSDMPFLLFEHNKDDPTENVLPHFHNEFEINVIISGSATYFVNSQSLVVNSGEVILIACNDVHSAVYTHPNLQYLTLLFDLSLLHSHAYDTCDVKYIKPIIENNTVIKNVLTKDFISKTNITNLILEIAYAYLNKKNSYELIVKANFFKLFSIFFDEKIIDITNDYTADDKHLDNMKIILTFIENNYSEKLILDDLSNLINYNKEYFTKIFKKYVGVSCFSYITELRIKKSQNLLKNTDLSISDIGQKVGYDSQSYFIKKFKEVNGITPKKYKELNH